MNDKPIYEVVSANEVPELAKIKKSNITVEITLGSSLKALEENKKAMEGIEKELEVKRAILKNVENFHPAVFGLDPELIVAAHTIHDARRYIALGEDTLKKFADANKDLEDEIKEIEIQTGLKAMSTEEKLEVINKKTCEEEEKK